MKRVVEVWLKVKFGMESKRVERERERCNSGSNTKQPSNNTRGEESRSIKILLKGQKSEAGYVGCGCREGGANVMNNDR